MTPHGERRVAADTSFLFPFLYVRHTQHEEARRLADEFSDAVIVTTDGVLSELLSLMSRQSLRRTALAFVNDALSEAGSYEVVLQTTASLQRGIERYASLTTGSPSLVDCMLMDAMDDQGIEDLLAFDRDFRHVGLYRVYPLRG